VSAAHAQAQKLTHSAVQVLGYEPYVAVAEALCRIAPMQGDKRALLVSTGTEAVENAVKLARSYTKRPAVICFEHAFHGRSLGGLSLTSRYKPYKAGFGPFLPEIYRLPYPYAYRQGLTGAESVAATKARMAEFFHTVVAPSEVAAIIVETVLGEGGFLVPPPGFLEHLREVATREGIVLIIDEVQAGFCRTGKLFAIQHFAVEPDLVCVAKSLAGGFPLGAVVGRAAIVNSCDPGALGGTYGGNPMACAAALASTEVIEEEGLLEHATHLGALFGKRMQAWEKKFAIVGNTRVKGCLMGVELVKDKKAKTPFDEAGKLVYQRAFSKGLAWIPAGHILRMSPPIVMPDEVAHKAMDIIEESIGEVEKELGYGK